MTRQLRDNYGEVMPVSKMTESHLHIGLNDDNIHTINLGDTGRFGAYFGLTANDDIYFQLTDSVDKPSFQTPSGQVLNSNWTLLLCNEVQQQIFDKEAYLHYRRADNGSVNISVRVYK